MDRGLRIGQRAPRRGNGEGDRLLVLRFIKQATGLGLTLAEIKEILVIRQGGRPPCSHVHQLLRDKAVELDRKLKDLVEVRERVRSSLAAWNRQPQKRAPV